MNSDSTENQPRVIKAKIVEFYNFNELYFDEGSLTREQESCLLDVIKIRHPNGSPAHGAQPYTTEVDQMKIYFSNKGAVRCRVEDLFTIEAKGKLEVRATILLVDSGRRRYSVPMCDLFDVPSWVEPIMNLEPMSKRARLFLSEHVTNEFRNLMIDKEIIKKLQRNKSRIFNIKILDFKKNVKGFKNETYVIDILDPMDNSLGKFLTDKFRNEIKKFEYNIKDIYDEAYYFREPIQQPIEPKAKNIYKSALQYFHEEKRDFNCYMKRRLHPVRVLNWSRTDSFYILPNDPNYLKSHALFQEEIQKLVKDIDEQQYDEFLHRKYVKGSLIFFKNSVDPVLGKWLRGIVVQEPNYQVLSWYKEEKLSIRKTFEFLYRLKSLDYGFECCRAPRNMRPVTDVKSFFKLGPWSIRCSLFGVYPFNHFKTHTNAFRNLLDQWVRERNTSLDQERHFYVLFRPTEISHKWATNKPVAEITLFHRHQAPYLAEHALRGTKREIRYDCLNYYLTYDQGVADYHIKGKEKSSKIELDVVVLNHLVTADYL